MKDQPPARTRPGEAPAATTPHASARSQWVREQRQARGWNIQQMARKLREAAALAGDTLPDKECLATMIRRWEKGGGISERYQLHYSHAFRIPPPRFGITPAPRAAPAEPAPDSTAREPATMILVIVLPAPGQPATPAGDPT